MTSEQVSPPSMGPVEDYAVQSCIANVGMQFHGKVTLDHEAAVRLVARYHSPYHEMAHTMHVLEIWPYLQTQDTIEVNGAAF